MIDVSLSREKKNRGNKEEKEKRDDWVFRLQDKDCKTRRKETVQFLLSLSILKSSLRDETLHNT